MRNRVRHRSVPFESFNVWGPAVKAIAQPQRPAGFEDRIEERLLEAGFPPDLVSKACAVIDNEVDDEATRRGSAVIAEMLWTSLGHSVAGTVLTRLLLGNGDVSLRDEAARLKCSHAALIDAEKRLRRTFNLPPAPSMLE